MRGAFRVVPLRVVLVGWRCDCGGDMVYEGSFGARHYHRCNKCGEQEIAKRRYPAREYLEDQTEVYFRQAEDK